MVLLERLPPVMRNALEACRPHMRAAAGFSALINLLYLAPTIYMMQIYDRVVPTGGVMTLLWITLVLGLTLGTLAALDNLRARLMSKASLRLNDELAGRILGQLVGSGQTTASRQAMREFDLLRQAITGPAMMALFDAPWTPIYLFAAFLIHPLLGLMILGGAAILIAIALVSARGSHSRVHDGLRANARAYQAQEALAVHAELIGALGIRAAMVKRQQQARAEGLYDANRALLAGFRYGALVKFSRMFMQSLALGLGAVLAIEGMISVGTIIAASVLLSRALQPVDQLVANWSQVNAARQSLTTLTELLGAAPQQRSEHHPLPVPEGRIAARSVGVRRAGAGAMILSAIDLEIAPGEIVGLIGPSGAGKSTLARVLAGALMPQLGEVRIDGAHFGDWEPDALARHIGYMPQQCVLLPGTIAENISRFALERGEERAQVAERVIEASRQAGIHEAILQLPGGYDAQVGAEGTGLSGGQAQRISLARALYGNPAVMILDEPGAALDGEGEQALIRVLQQARARGAAVLIAAHQPQLVALCDRLLVLHEGAVTHQGATRKVIEALRETPANGNVRVIKRRGTSDA